MTLFNKLNEATEATSPQEVVETLSNVLYRQAAVKGEAAKVEIADYLRVVASNIETGNLSRVVAGVASKKAITSAANGRKGGRPKGSKNKPKEEVNTEA